MIFGVTGTRYGVSSAQQAKFTSLLFQEVDYRNIDRSPLEKDQFHHGACVGTDETTARIAKETFGLWTVAHPSNIYNFTTKFVSDVTLKMKEPLVRNMDIVYEVQFLFALPAIKNEVLRSGTWSTIRAARSRSVPGVIIFPDGTEEPL